MELILNDLDIKNMVVYGLQSEFCISNTCLGVLKLGYRVGVVSDMFTCKGIHRLT
ncbi:MAG: isochorismatase family protein [Pseudomonadales bacterium]|nr:isochorismatase family protein [Pseudomonadales bacterium]